MNLCKFDICDIKVKGLVLGLGPTQAISPFKIPADTPFRAGVCAITQFTTKIDGVLRYLGGLKLEKFE